MGDPLAVYGQGWPELNHEVDEPDGGLFRPGQGAGGRLQLDGICRLSIAGGPDGEDPLWQAIQQAAAAEGRPLSVTFGPSFRELLGLSPSARLTVHRAGWPSLEGPHNVFMGTLPEAEEVLVGLGPQMPVRRLVPGGAAEQQPWGRAAKGWNGLGAVYWRAPWAEASEVEDLVRLMASLRAEGGCPWDRAQTPLSLRTYLLEEAAEAVDALTGGQKYKIVEELGDLLLQIAFHAEIGRERGAFTLSDITAAVTSKMIRRHPHVFGKGGARTAGEVDTTWQAIKEKEGGGKRSLLDEVPSAFGSAEEATKLLKLALRTGLLKEAGTDGDTPSGRLIKAFSSLLASGVDPAVALREANLRLRRLLSETGGAPDTSPQGGKRSHE